MPKHCTCSVWQPKVDRISFTLLAKIGLRSVCHKPSNVEFLQLFLEFAALDSLVPAALDWIWFELWPTYEHNEMSIEPLDSVEPFVSGKVFVKKNKHQMFSLKDRLTYLAAYSMQNRTCQSDQSCRWLASIRVVHQPVENCLQISWTCRIFQGRQFLTCTNPWSHLLRRERRGPKVFPRFLVGDWKSPQMPNMRYHLTWPMCSSEAANENL